MHEVDSRITASPAEFRNISGLGTTTIYAMIDDGRLQSIKLGKRRLIVLDSYRKLIADSLANPAPKTKTPGRYSRQANGATS
jgi:hypothetical protein